MSVSVRLAIQKISLNLSVRGTSYETEVKRTQASIRGLSGDKLGSEAPPSELGILTGQIFDVDRSLRHVRANQFSLHSSLRYWLDNRDIRSDRKKEYDAMVREEFPNEVSTPD